MKPGIPIFPQKHRSSQFLKLDSINYHSRPHSWAPTSNPSPRGDPAWPVVLNFSDIIRLETYQRCNQVKTCLIGKESPKSAMWAPHSRLPEERGSWHAATGLPSCSVWMSSRVSTSPVCTASPSPRLPSTGFGAGDQEQVSKGTPRG